MKKWVLFLLVTPLIFTSCQKKEVPTLVNLIPKDAKFVLAIDNEQIIKKGGFDKLSQFKFYQKLVESLDGNKNKDLILNVLDNPGKRGLNINQAYLFMEMHGTNPLIVYVTAMKDKALFEQNLIKLAELPADQIQDKLTYRMFQKDEARLVWDDKLFFLFVGDVENINYDHYFRLQADESLMAQADFSEFVQRLSDIGLWLPMQTYADVLEMLSGLGAMDGVKIPMMNDMAGINMHLYLDFNNDEIKLEANMTPKAAVDAMYDKYPVFKWNPNQDMLKDFPETAYFVFKVALDLPQYIKILKQTMSEIDVHNSEMELVVDALEDPTVNMVLNALGGDIIFSLYGFAEGPMPLLGLSLSVNSEADFQKLLAMIPKGIAQNNGRYYVLDFGVAAGYLAYKDNRVFATADEKSMETFLSGGNAKNITANAAIGKAMANSPSLFYINLNIDDYPKVIKDIAKSGYVDENVMATIAMFKDFSVYMNSKYNVQASLKFKSGKENSLKQLIKLIDSAN